MPHLQVALGQAREHILCMIHVLAFGIRFAAIMLRLQEEERGTLRNRVIFYILIYAERRLHIVFVPANRRNGARAEDGDVERPVGQAALCSGTVDGVLDTGRNATDVGKVSLDEAAESDGVVGELVDDVGIDVVVVGAVHGARNVVSVDVVAAVMVNWKCGGHGWLVSCVQYPRTRRLAVIRGIGGVEE